MKKVIITGVAGFLGSALASILSKEYEIIGIDREYWEGFNFLHEQGRKVTFFQTDINDSLPGFTKDIYAVIHLAAKAGVRESHSMFDVYVDDNILGLKNILDKCVDSWKPKRFIFASSSSVYGDCSNPTDEYQPYNPQSLYALTKIAGEQMISTYRNNGLLLADPCILRIYTVYGPNQRKTLAMNKFITALSNDEPLIVYGNGEQVRDFTYIDDLCEGINNLLNKTYMPYILNMGYGDTIVSINEVIKILGKIMEKIPEIKYEPMNRFDVMRTEADSNVARNYLPKEKVNIKEGLRRQVECHLMLQ